MLPPQNCPPAKKRGGIPYTSTGCANCKKRKIKCDLAKPECAKCIKKRIPCPGYDKNRNFLQYRVVSEFISNGETQKRLIRQPVGSSTPSPSLPGSLDISPEVRTQLFARFMDAFFDLTTTDLNGEGDSLYLLMTRFPTLSNQSELLDRAVMALVSVFLGKKAGDARLKHHGTEIYSTALNNMGLMLQKNDSPTLDMLYSGIIFHTYETLRGNADGLRNCYTHVQGATAIIKHHDCHNHDDKILIKAILNRQKWAACYFLTNTQYGSEVDWGCLTLGLENSPMDQLFGTLAECAILQRDLNIIIELNAVNMDDSCEAVLQRCYDLEERMQNDWLSGPAGALKLNSHPSSCHRETLAYEASALPLDPDLDPYSFENLATAKAYILFWVGLAFMRRVIYRVEKLLSREADPTRMLFYAKEMCRSMAYCLQPSTRMSTNHSVIFAVSQASKCYVDCGDREWFMWCQGIYPLISSRGFDVAIHCSEVERKYWNASQSQSIIYRLPVAYDYADMMC